MAAAFGVVLIHFWPRQANSPFPTLDALVVGTSRFAVPFFFATSGFFLRDRIDTLSQGWRFSRKWLRILLAWHAIHAVWFTLSHFAKSADPFHQLPVWVHRLATWDALFEGVAWPLWYLHSLVLCVLLASALPGKAKARWLVPLGIFLYVLALLWGPWRHLAPDWMPPTPLYINPRGFLFTALLPFAVGLVVPVPKPLLAGAAVVLGILLQSSEILLLPPGRDGLPTEYFMGSALLGVSLLWAGLHWNPRWAGGVAWGAASLPMYLLQLIGFGLLVQLAQRILSAFAAPGWEAEVLAVVASLPLFALACHQVSRNNLWRKFHS